MGEEVPLLSNSAGFVLIFLFFVPEFLHGFYSKLSWTFLNKVNFKLCSNSISVSSYCHLR